MNDEIKEMLDDMFHIIIKYEEDFEYLEENEIRYQLPYNKMQKLYDYITNLQQEKPHLHTNTEWEDLLDYKGRTYIELDRFKQVQQENERLKEEKDNLYLDNTMLKAEKDIYKQGYEDFKNLLNILQNGSDSQ